MATASKSRRPVTIASTPKLKTPRKQREGARQAALETFDLEVSHRTNDLRLELDRMLAEFLAMADMEILKLPATMRSMTLGDLEACWAGSITDTSRALAQKRFARNAPETDQDAVMAAAKRKREETDSPSRTSKTPRTKPLPALPGKRAKGNSKRTKPALPAATGASTLPQDHEFNPLLPKTPKFPRAPKRNESFFSQNGSPVDVALDGSSSEDETELPDPERMEAAAARGSPSKSRSAPSRKAKRAPSLLFRTAAPSGDQEGEAHISLSDGRTLSFNPLQLSPGRIDEELGEGGLSEQEKNRVKAKVGDLVCGALSQQMQRWKGMGL